MVQRGRIALLVLVPILIVWAALASQLARDAVHREVTAGISYLDLAPEGTPAADFDATPHHEEVDDSEPATDLYGNEVTDAVAKYKLDATGSLYELHSPQTELPRLGSPKS